ncbi:DNA integrity scanning protein DisA nucleotide-binding domain protein [uncultured Desulfobacter sp.]|uniref:DNA integrity scanning protein DisA nucleotide-binding domain protein n=1 Tax=uncultured Desulfobacter sp. TaxID=240139 RepID=UPI002AAAC50D|nr:DNA integrity scanning protein DisA nucleotide-binding domain protein [uncultured Desulfobacter sp.]
MANHGFIRRCIRETIEGLREGLTHFSGPSRAAVIYAITPEDPIYICDPQNLLAGHEPKFKELYIDSQEWRKKNFIQYDKKKFSNLVHEKNLGLAGLISYGGRSSAIGFQMWFTDHHPDMCTIGPTERWLEHAVYRFSHDMANEEELYTGISGSFLKEYATHAIRDYIVDAMNVLIGWDTRLRVYPLLEAVLKISRTPEEGEWPRGKLIFVEKNSLSKMNFILELPEAEQPVLDNVKHIRKLLQSVENSDLKLVATENTIIGITRENHPHLSILADFKGRYGFLALNDELVCSFSDGHFKSTTHKAKLVQVEEALMDSDLGAEDATALFKIVAGIVHSAASQRHGCSIVIDLNESPVFIMGHSLLHPLDLKNQENCDLARSLSKVDGALHIGADVKLHRFACLLQGRNVPGENRARGARFNSALRFTAEHKNVIVIVVSSDTPVSIMMGGEVLETKWKRDTSVMCNIPVPLETWVSTGK